MQKKQGTNTCSVYGCGARVKPIYHFPHPNRGLDRFNCWVAATSNPSFANLSNIQIYKRGFVCFQHFVPSDFVDGTHTLLKSAVPSVLPPKNNTLPHATMDLEQCLSHNGDEETLDMVFTTPKKQYAFFSSQFDLTPRARKTQHNTLKTQSTVSTKGRTLNFQTAINETDIMDNRQTCSSPKPGPSGIQFLQKLDDLSESSVATGGALPGNLHYFVFGRQEPDKSSVLEVEMQKLYVRFKKK